MVTLLPSLQFATPHSVQPDGKPVFITSLGKLVCAHGECSSTICSWIRAERMATEKGVVPPPRGGSRGLTTCDCQNTDGLNRKSGETSRPAPAGPMSLFEFLEQQDSELIVVKGREARRIPFLPGPTFLTRTGRLCCRHGASRQSLIKKKKAGCRPSTRLPTCGCTLKPLPVRVGLAGAQMHTIPKTVVCQAVATVCPPHDHPVYVSALGGS